MTIKQSKSVIERFNDKLEPVPESGCWLWTAGVRGRGYGEFWVRGQGKGRERMDAHRYSYLAHKGEIPPGMHVCHSCDVPQCVNPSHLFLGSDQDNKADMVAKGRSARGAKNGASAHTKDDILYVRKLFSSGLTQAEIVRRTGIPRNTVNCIVRNKTWSHL